MTDFLTVEELASMHADVTDLTVDPQIAPPVTYRAFQSQTFTPSTGSYTPTYADTVVGAVRNHIPTKEVVASQGTYQQGDLEFIIHRAALATAPAKEDRIVDGTTTYGLISVDSDPIALLWRIVARREV